MRSWLFVVSVAYCLCLAPPETTQVPVDTVSIQGLPDVVTTETPTSTTGIAVINYHLDVTIVNHCQKNVIIIMTFPGRAHHRFVIPVGGSYPIKSTPSTRQQIVITAYDAETFIPVMINGKSAVFLYPSITPVRLVYYISSARTHSVSTQVSSDAVSTQGPTDALKTQAATDAVTKESPTSTTGIVIIYHLDVTIVNRYGKDVIILVTLPGRAAQRFVIPVGGSYPIKSTFSTLQQTVLTAYDAATFIPVMIDDKSAVFVFPSITPLSRVYYIPSAQVPIDVVSTHAPTDAVSTQGSTDALKTQAPTDVVTTESPTSTTGNVITYHLDVTIVNHYGKGVIILVTLPGRAAQRFVIPVGGSYPIKSTFSTSQQTVITAYDAATLYPVMLDAKSAVFLFPSVKPVSLVYYISSAPTDAAASTQPPTHYVSTEGPTDAMSTQGSSDVVTTESPTSTTGIVIIYHLDVTIVNRYQKNVIILMTFPGRAHQRFVIPVGGRYPIKSTLSTRQQIVITAYDAETFIPVMINGKSAVFVFPSVTPVSLIYYIPSETLTAVLSTQAPIEAVSRQRLTYAVITQVPTDVSATTETPTSLSGIAGIYHQLHRLMKDSKYGSEIFISGRRKYTIENDSINPEQFRANNPSVFVNNVPFSKFLKQLNEKLRK